MRRHLPAVLLLASAFPSPAAAGPVTVDAAVTGVFTGPPVSGLTGLGTSQIVFGQGVGGSPPSSIGFVGGPVSGLSGSVVTLGQINFFNGVIATTSIAPNPFDFALQVTIALSGPSPATATVTIPLSQFASLNDGGPFDNADTLTLTNPATIAFSAGGWDYSLQVLGFGPAVGDGFGTANTLTVFEWGDTRSPANGSGLLTAPLLGQVNAIGPSVVANPEPASLAVFGLLAVGGALHARRRRAC